MTENKLRFISFALNNINFALPIETVYKIVNHKLVYSSGITAVGITNIGESEITVVDLSRRFFNDKHNNETANYLIIVKNKSGEFYGIAVP